MKRALSVAVLVGLGMLAHTASANSITYNFSGFQAGLPVSGFATFTTLANEVQISLTNSTVDPTSVAQNLSDLSFTLNTGQNSGVLTASSGLERTVASDGTFTNGATVSTGWALSTNGSGLKLDVLGTPVAPAHTVIGSPDATNVYTNANGSIARNGPHNPFLFGPVSFDLLVLGVTSASDVSSATFSFGTTEGNDLSGVPAPAPEPATLLLLGSSMVGLGLARRRRTRAR